jgi:hypothetical protein
MLVTDQPSPWIRLMCVTPPCQGEHLLAATHLQLWDRLHKAQDHYEKHHARKDPP